MIKAVDQGGRESAAPAAIFTDLGDAPPRLGADEEDFKAASWPGTIDGGTESGGDILADLDSSEPMWFADDALMFPSPATAMWVLLPLRRN